MEYVEGIHRKQRTLFPDAFHGNITGDNPVRILDVLIESLDLHEMGVQGVVLVETGRPPYHPGDLPQLFIFGCFNRIRSSRQKGKLRCRRF